MPKVDQSYLDARRREILEAAMECFSREGFHRTTMQDIVKETGRSAGAIYRYFKTKEDIVAAIAHERHAIEETMLEQALDVSDPEIALRQLARGLLGRLADPGEQRWRRITVQVWAEALRDERVMQIVRSGLDEPIEMLAEIVRKAQSDGALPAELDPVGTARVCAAIFHGLVLQQAWDPTVDVGAYVDTTLALIEALVSTASSSSAKRTRRRRSS
jgi:AcrR family transcriptional regulator